MRGRIAFQIAVLALAIGPLAVIAQQPPTPPQQTPQRGGGNGGRRGGFVPGQTRPPFDQAQVDRGKAIYGINCNGCHGSDLRGGDLGGPNLLRSQVALSDVNGELIVPIIQGSRQSSGMPAIDMPPADAAAVAAYVRSVLETIGTQGKPPGVGLAPTTIVVGNASEGQAYFATKCASCHSVTGDLQGLASRYADAKALQNAWVSGGGGRGRGPAAGGASSKRTVTVAVTTPTGVVEGNLVRIDDFLVSLEQADGTIKTFRRDGNVPKVDLKDPMKGHRDLLSTYSDKDMHDLTAYLVTLK